MRKTILAILFGALVVCVAPAAVVAQGPWAGRPEFGRPAGGPAPWGGNPGLGRPGVPQVPGLGAGNFPGVMVPPVQMPGMPQQDKRRDDTLRNVQHVMHGIHLGSHSIGSAAEHAKDVHVPSGMPASSVTPLAELHHAPRIAPVMSEGSAIARGLARGKGWFVGIGGAIAAAFGAVFGRRKDS